MRRTHLTVLVLSLIMCAAMPAVASAHIFRSSGNIGVELHVEPDDQPIAGQATHYRFEFEDSSGKFNLSGCTCTISFSRAGRTIGTLPVANQGSSTSENVYTFPEAGTYTATLTGTPKQHDAFTAFRFDYPIRVGSRHEHALPVAAWFDIGGGVLAVTAIGVFMERNSRKSQPS